MRNKQLKGDCTNAMASNYLTTLYSIKTEKHGKLSVNSVDKPEIKVNENLLMLAVLKKVVLYNYKYTAVV